MAGLSADDTAWINSFVGKETEEELVKNNEAFAKQMRSIFNALVGQGFTKSEALTLVCTLISTITPTK